MRRPARDLAGQDRPPLRVEVIGESDGSFESFYMSQYRGLVRLAWGVEGRRDLAEEAVQDAMIVVHRNWHKVSTYDKPGMFARRVLLNGLVSRDRRRRRERAAVERAGPCPTTHIDSDPPGAAFWQAIRALPERQQQAVVLHYVEDLPVAEIAGILDIAVPTVKVHLHRGRLALFEKFASTSDKEEL